MHFPRRQAPVVVACLALLLLAAACSVETAEFDSAAQVSPAATGDGADSDTGTASSDGDEAASADAEPPDLLARAEEPDDSAPTPATDQTGATATGTPAGTSAAPNGAASDSDDVHTGDMVPGGTDTEDVSTAVAAGDNTAAAQGTSDEQQANATLVPSNTSSGRYGSASISGEPHTNPAATAPSASPADDLSESERVSRGALLIEAFGLAGSRLLSDAVRVCVHDAFIGASEPLRIDQIVAAMPTIDTDVAVVVGALEECGGLGQLARTLNDELAEGLGDLYAPASAGCISGFYSDTTGLTDLLQTQTAEDRAGAAVGVPALAECIGFGDILAADLPLVGTNERICLNERAVGMIESLVTVDVREEVASLDPDLITDALAECLPEQE